MMHGSNDQWQKTHPISELDSRTNLEVLARARQVTEKKRLNIRLDILREKYKVKQSEVSNFTKTAVLKLENRKDIRVSTLIDYLESLGMGLEITAYSKILWKKSCYCAYEIKKG